MISANNKLIVEPYKGSGKIEARPGNTGYATIKQKSTIIGLKLLADGKIPVGNTMMDVKKGQKVYFLEEILYAMDWSKKPYNLAGSEEMFMLAESSYVVAVE